MALTGCSVTKFVTELPGLLKHVWRLPTSLFFCRRRSAPTFSPSTVRCLPHSAQLTIFQRRMDRTLFGSTRAPSWPLLPSSSTKLNKSLTHVVVLLKAASLPTPSPSSRILRYGPAKIGWYALKFTLPTPAEEDTTRRFSARLQWSTGPWRDVRYARPFDLPASHHSSLQLWLSLLAWSRYSIWPCRTQTLGCTSQIPSRSGCSQVLLASITAQILIFQATVTLLFLLSLNATFAANSQSLNLRNSLSPGRLKMKRYWIMLPRHAVKWNALNKS